MNRPIAVRRSCTVGMPCTIGVAKSGVVMTRTRFSSLGRLSTWLAATIQDPPTRFTGPIGFSTIFSSFSTLATRRMKTSGVPPAEVPMVSSMGPFGARGSAACARARPGAAAMPTAAATAARRGGRSAPPSPNRDANTFIRFLHPCLGRGTTQLCAMMRAKPPWLDRVDRVFVARRRLRAYGRPRRPDHRPDEA